MYRRGVMCDSDLRNRTLSRCWCYVVSVQRADLQSVTVTKCYNVDIM